MIIILFGVSCSGKSVIGLNLSQQIQWPFYDADDFHSEENKKKMKAAIPLTDEDRLPWLKTLAKLILQHIVLEEDMILACSALKESYRAILNVDPSCYFIYLKGSFDLISKRIKNRKGHFFHPKLLQSQFDTLEKPKNCLVIDIDNTVENITKIIRNKIKK